MKMTIPMVAMTALCTAASADTLNVPQQYDTIQEAIDAAVDGDTIQLDAGTYKESGIDTLGKAITIKGSIIWPGGPLSVIEGQGNEPVFIVSSGETQTTAFRHLIVQLGKAQYGGAMYISGSSPFVEDVLFSGNQADNGGGAIFAGAGSAPAFKDCTFYQNATASSGGAVLVKEASISFESCEMTYNQSNYAGGAVYAHAGQISLIDSHLNQNTAPQRGGAVALYLGELIIQNSHLEGNKSGYDGGAVHAHTASVDLQDTLFKSNKAQTGSGGALHAYEGSADIQNSEFHSNWAHEHGGALLLRYGSGSTVSNCVVFNNTAQKWGGGVAHIDTSAVWNNSDITANTAQKSGGGVYNFGSDVSMLGCTIKQNSAGSNGGGGVASILSQATNLKDAQVCGNLPDQIKGNWQDDGGNSIEDLCGWEADAAPCCVATGCALLSEDVCNQLGGMWLSPDSSCADCPDICLEDVNADGTVDVADLLVVFSAWGPCL